MESWKDKLQNIGKTAAEQLEMTAKSRARENKDNPLGQEYERFAESMRNFKNSPMLNSQELDEDSEDDFYDDLEEDVEYEDEENLEQYNYKSSISKQNIHNNKESIKSSKYNKKPFCPIGTIGHVGHGKTTLTAAITKVLSERVPGNKTVEFESIDKPMNDSLSILHVEYETERRRYGHIDCPNYDDYVKNMISGSVEMHAAILVVDAIEGVMAQTWDYISLVRQVGVPHIVVFMNKCDMVDDEEMLELVDMEIRETLDEYGYPGDDIPIIQGSALKALEEPFSKWGDQILELIDAVDKRVPNPVDFTHEPFLMSIESIFTVGGRTVVTGRVERGILYRDDIVEIIGIHKEPRRARVAGIERYRALLDEAWPGDDIGVLLHDVQRSEVARGECLCQPSSIRCHCKFEAVVYILTKDEGGRSMPIVNHCNILEFIFRGLSIKGVCDLIDFELCWPGDFMTMNVEIFAPVPIEPGLHFTMREDNEPRGFGKVISILD